jgi:hypothetical protein
MCNEARSLQYALLAFCAFASASLIVIYLVAPAIYVQMLPVQTSAGDDAHPSILTVFLVGILLLVALLAVGVLRRWRWRFWLILVAFACSVLQIPANVLELAGVVPLHVPAWYGFLRMLVASVQGIIAVWMIRLYRSNGVWGLGKHARMANRT